MFTSFLVAASKAPRKQFGGCSSGSSSSSTDSPARSNGPPLVNHAKMWPTPKWQKGKVHYFQSNTNTFLTNIQTQVGNFTKRI